jgi:ribosomal protein L24E
MKSKFCDNEACRGKFGMVVHRWMTYRFCSNKCKESFLAKLAAHRERIRQWFTYRESS